MIWPSRTSATAALGAYLNGAAHYVEKPKEKVDISSLAAAALNTIALVRPGELATLQSTLTRVGDHLNDARQRFLNEEAQKAMGTHIGNIGGDYIIGDKVGGDKIGGDYAGHDLNKAGGDQIQAGRDANVQKDIDSSVERLSELVGQLKAYLPAQQQPEIQQHLETVKQQASAPKPDRGKFEVSAKGLVEAAKAVGQMAGPIVKTVLFLGKALFGVSIAL